jgi:hypothetical protein
MQFLHKAKAPEGAYAEKEVKYDERVRRDA